MIYFFNSTGNFGSDKMRCTHILEHLNTKNINTVVVPQSSKSFIDKVKDIKNSKTFWIKTIEENALKTSKKNNNCNIYDCVDNYVYNKNKLIHCIKSNLLDIIIVNNNFMKLEIEKMNENIKVIVIYHHYDPIYKTIPVYEPETFTFGYIGSLASLNHSENFRFHKELGKEFNIVFLDSEDGKYYNISALPQSGKPQKQLDNIEIKFHCHISIRKLNSDLSKYKTSAKLATSCAFRQNILTTNEECIRDLLPPEYPFILLDDDLKSIKQMMNKIVNDYNSNKVLWNKGLEIINDVRKHLDLENSIGKSYEKIISNDF